MLHPHYQREKQEELENFLAIHLLPILDPKRHRLYDLVTVSLTCRKKLLFLRLVLNAFGFL